MAKYSSVAPKERINITFKPATAGAQEELELPLKLLVLGDFTQREDLDKLEMRKPVSVDKNTLDEVLAKQALSLNLNLNLSQLPNLLRSRPQKRSICPGTRLQRLSPCLSCNRPSSRYWKPSASSQI